jgi:hypothetical protein
MLLSLLRTWYWLLVLAACQADSDPVAGPTGGPSGGGQVVTGTCDPTPPTRPGAVKILFVGNSLTYYNDLPAKVAAIGQGKGNLIEKEMLAEPNYALEDHWNEGCLQTHIKTGYYDFVVVQQGPSSQADGAMSLLEYGGYLQELCKANDTKLAFFMVWPARVNYHTFPGVITNYTNAAYATGAILCPAGQAWKQYIDRTGDWSYYGPDQFHPSPLGTQVAAEVIYKSIFP